MLLQLYKTNQPSILLTVPLLVALVWSPSFIAQENISTANNTPVFEVVESIFFNLWWLKLLASIVLISISSVFLNNILNRYDIFQKANHLPILFFSLFSGLLITNQVFHPVLFANLFVVLAIGKICSIHQQGKVFAIAFDTGFYIGLAALFAPIYLLLIVGIWISFIILRPFIWREWFIALFGAAMPILFTGVILFLFDKTINLSSLFQFDAYQNVHLLSPVDWLNTTLLSVFGIITLLSFFQFSSQFRLSNMRSKKLKQVILFFILFLIAVFFVACFNSACFYAFSILSIPLSFILPFYFYAPKYKWLSGTFFYILIGLTVTNFYYNLV